MKITAKLLPEIITEPHPNGNCRRNAWDEAIPRRMWHGTVAETGQVLSVEPKRVQAIREARKVLARA